MKQNTCYFLLILFILASCGSTASFNNFFKSHKTDMGVTAIQVPRFMLSLAKAISPDLNTVFGNVKDFKVLRFSNISNAKKTTLINEINAITANNYTDILRQNTIENTKIITVQEANDVVKKVIFFNTTLDKTTAFYLKGNFNPNRIKALSKTNDFEKLANQLTNSTNTTLIPKTPNYGN